MLPMTTPQTPQTTEETPTPAERAIAAPETNPWLVNMLQTDDTARQVYDLNYAVFFAWCSSNTIEGPGASVERRHAAYQRYEALLAETYRAERLCVEQHDRFVVREVRDAAQSAAWVDCQAARAREIADANAI